jgi:hypothetical protein
VAGAGPAGSPGARLFTSIAAAISEQRAESGKELQNLESSWQIVMKDEGIFLVEVGGRMG